MSSTLTLVASLLLLVSCSSAQLCGSETNAARAQNGGLPALQYSAQLEAAARTHNNVMISQNCFSHQCSGEADLGTRTTAQGYRWYALAENLAAGHANCQAAVNGWLQSPGHRANLLHASVTQYGCAMGQVNNAYRQFWTCVYGASY